MKTTSSRWLWTLAVSSLSALALPAAAQACPDYLQRLDSPILAQAPGNARITSLCDLYDQYHAALDDLNPRAGGEAERIRMVFGPRFINYPDFTAPHASELSFDPWRIYDPAPKTWQNWENAQALVRTFTQANVSAGLAHSQPGLTAIDDNMLLRIHAAALEGLPRFNDMFRTNELEIGRAFWKSSAMPVNAVTQEVFPLDESSRPTASSRQIVGWHPTLCYEDMGDDERALVDAVRVYDIPEHPDRTFVDLREGRPATLQCGYLQYPSPSLVRGMLHDWMNDINSYITTWFSQNPHGDPLLVASRAQRWFVSIHPFVGGNGRTSRFMMDYVLTSLGLPAPVLTDMNMDLASTEQEWAQKVGSALKQTVYLLKWCKRQLDRDPSAPACQLTAHQPSG